MHACLFVLVLEFTVIHVIWIDCTRDLKGLCVLISYCQLSSDCYT